MYSNLNKQFGTLTPACKYIHNSTVLYTPSFHLSHLMEINYWTPVYFVIRNDLPSF